MASSQSQLHRRYPSYSPIYYNSNNHEGGTILSPQPVRTNPELLRLRTESPQGASLVARPLQQSLRDEESLGRGGSSPVQPVSPLMSRQGSDASSHSAVSNLTATTAATISSTPHNAQPPPAYVGHAGAVQVMSEHRSGRKQSASDDDEADRPKDDVKFSIEALAVINSFLDHLLYSFLSNAHSTSLPQLRLAIADVLKPQLARDVIASAEEDLRELLSGTDEEEEMNTQHNSTESKRQWDLPLVFMRTRLRVMVYSRLGDVDDEAEERYVKEEELLHGSERRFSQATGLVSWATAIFLTSVLEHIAQPTLQITGQAAYSRVRRHSRTQRLAGVTNAGITVVAQPSVRVEELDVEKVALDYTLGRLFRGFRKSLRNSAATSPTGEQSEHHKEAMAQPSASSLQTTQEDATPIGTMSSTTGEAKILEFTPELHVAEYVLAANIPLPIGERDVDEIEVPGLARDPDDDAEGEVAPPVSPKARRRHSVNHHSSLIMGGTLLVAEDESSLETPTAAASKPPLTRQRSMSAPTPARNAIEVEGVSAMPGAFPVEGEEEQEKRMDDPTLQPVRMATIREKPEQKANAAEMAAYKRVSRALMEPLGDDAAQQTPTEELKGSKGESEPQGIVEGAVAGALAAAAAIVATVSGSKDEQKDAEPKDEHKDTAAVEDTPARDIEELDRRKSLADIKALTAIPAQDTVSESRSRSLTPRNATTPPPPLARRDSEESFHLNGGTPISRKSPAKRMSVSGSLLTASNTRRDTVGIGKSLMDRRQTPSPDLEQEVRGNPMRQTRLFLGDTPERARSEETQLTESPTQVISPVQQFLDSRSLGLTNNVSAQAQPEPTNPLALSDHNRNSLIRPKRASVPGVALTGNLNQSSMVENLTNGQSWAAALDKLEGRPTPSPPNLRDDKRTSVPVGPSSAGGLHLAGDTRRNTLSSELAQEHPVVQRMTSLKRNINTALKHDPELAALTSASIRGPEDFDMFMMGEDTTKYTLTPEPAREQAQAQARDAPSRTSVRSSPPGSHETRTGRSSVSKQATSADDSHNGTKTSLKDKRRSVSRPPIRNISVHRRSGLIAREPRVMTDSTRDFADFIRSTGPDKEQEVLPILSPASRSTTSLHSLRSAHINGSRASSLERTRSVTKTVIEDRNIPPVPAMPGRSSKSMSKAASMLPRGPTATTDGNSELIDFIRSGPDQPGSHRISRTVAPWRSTMDSDQLTEIGNRINGRGPPALAVNTNVGSSHSQNAYSANTDRYSVSSPISSSATVQPAHSGHPQRLSNISGVLPSPGPALPVKKQVRTKDPYAAYDNDLDDDEDEDNDLLTALPKGGKRQEESLVDFLNNSEPPSNSTPQALMSGGTGTPPPRRNSRTGSIDSLVSGDGRKKSVTRLASLRTGSLRSAQSTVRGSQTATSDLVDFLNSGPPNSFEDDAKSAPAPVVNNQRKLTLREEKAARKKAEKGRAGDQKVNTPKVGGFFSGFGRSASSKKTHGDMP